MRKVVAVGLLVVAVGWAAWAGNSSVQFGHLDGAWIQAHEFRIGERLAPADRVWVRVYDPDIAAAQEYWVTLHNPGTGDSVRHRLSTVVAGATATSAAPIALVPATGTPSLADNRLEVRPGDTIYVYYTDPLDAADQSSTDAVAVLGKVHLYEGAPQPGDRNLVATFTDPNPIQTAIGRAAAVAAEGLARMYRPWIVVTSGDYREDVEVNLSDIVIESQALQGATLHNAGANAPVRISADNVTLRGFVIELDISAAGAAGAHGIYAGAARAGIRIERNLIRNIHGTTDRYAIYFTGNLTASAIVGNTIEGTFGMTHTVEGIRIGGARVTNVLLDGNTIRECRDHGVHFSNAAGTAEDLRIVGNEIVNCNADRDGVGSGVHFNAGFTVRAVRIAGNTFKQNEHGVNLQLAGGNSVRDLVIEGNTFLDHRRTVDGNQLERALQSGLRVIAAGALTPVNFQVRNNKFAGNEAGILLTCADPVNAPNGFVQGVQIAGNVIAGNDIGIWLRHQNNTIMENDIAGNVLWGVHALSIGGDPRNMVNARDNWWGHSTGPRHFTRNPAGQGNPVTDHVDFLPFRTGSAVPDGTIELRDAAIPPAAAGTFDIAFTGGNLAELQVGPTSVVTFRDASKVQVTNVAGVAPYQVLAWEYSEADGVGRLTFTVSLTPRQNPQAGVIARVTVTGSGAAGDTVQMTLAPSPVDKCVDKIGNPIRHAIRNGRLTLSAAAPPAQAKGDVNGDGTVDITDARWAAEAAIGSRTLTAAQFAAADVAPPFGAVDITDARWIAEAAVGLRTLAVPLPAAPSATGPAAVRLDAGVLQIAGVEVSDVQGRILYNPASVSVAGLSGLNGFEVLAWRNDPATGTIVFAAARLHGGGAGPVLQVQTRGDAGALSVALDVLRGPDGKDIPIGTAGAPALLSVRNTPNPVTDVHTTYFEVKATLPVVEIRVLLHDLAGRLVWDSGWGPNGLAWHLNDLRGNTVANGVYLYQVQVKLEGLGGVLASGLQKLAVYR